MLLCNRHPVSLAPSLPAPLQAAGLLQAGAGSPSTCVPAPWHCAGLAGRAAAAQELSCGHGRAQEGGAGTGMRQAFVCVTSGSCPATAGGFVQVAPEGLRSERYQKPKWSRHLPREAFPGLPANT